MRRRLLVGLATLAIAGLTVTVWSSQHFDDIFQRHPRIRLEKITRLYNYLLPPSPTLILTGQLSVADIFADNVQGRVTPVGQFHDSEAVNEYFFGLATTPLSNISGVAFPSLVVSGDKVAVEVDIHVQPTTGGAQFTLRQTGFFTFDRHDRVVSFDLSILNLGEAVNPRTTAEREIAIRGICATLTGMIPQQAATCPGEYSGVTAQQQFVDCVAFMHTIPYGTWDRANSNTVVCRELHTLLTPFRPEVHCPHAGKTGGHACITFPYDSFFDVEF